MTPIHLTCLWRCIWRVKDTDQFSHKTFGISFQLEHYDINIHKYFIYISPKISQVDIITGALHFQYILSANISFIGVIFTGKLIFGSSRHFIIILKQNLIQTNLPISRRITWIIIIALFQTFKVRDLLTSIFLLPFHFRKYGFQAKESQYDIACSIHAACLVLGSAKSRCILGERDFYLWELIVTHSKVFLKWCRLLFIFKVTIT